MCGVESCQLHMSCRQLYGLLQLSLLECCAVMRMLLLQLSKGLQK